MKNIRSGYGFIRTIRNRRSKPMSYSTRAGAARWWGERGEGVKPPCAAPPRQWAASSRRVNIVLLRVFRKQSCHVLLRAALLSPDPWFAWYAWSRFTILYFAEYLWTGCIDASPGSRARVIVRKTGSKLVEIQIEENYIESSFPVHFLPFLLGRYVRLIYCVSSSLSFNHDSFISFITRIYSSFHSLRTYVLFVFLLPRIVAWNVYTGEKVNIDFSVFSFHIVTIDCRVSDTLISRDKSRAKITSGRCVFIVVDLAYLFTCIRVDSWRADNHGPRLLVT